MEKADVRREVGIELGLVPVGQDLESQDDIRIGVAFDETYERLKEKGLATWALGNPVPNKLVPFFRLMIAEKLLTTYSVPESRYQRIKNDAGPNGAIAEAKLAEMAIPRYQSTEDVQGF